jgi:hypothetical protein
MYAAIWNNNTVVTEAAIEANKYVLIVKCHKIPDTIAIQLNTSIPS